MKLFGYILVFFALGGIPFVYAEEITDFNSVLTIYKDGTVSVVETITYDFATGERHGIFRVLETKHPQKATAWYKKRLIDVAVTGVTKDGVAESFQTKNTEGVIRIQIGSPDVTISGEHVYTIAYRLTGALSYGPQGTELYYNVTGNNWEIPIKAVMATIVDSSGKLLATARDCYVGQTGETTRCTLGLRAASSSTFIAYNLEAGSGLTVAHQLQTNEVAELLNEKTSLNWLGYVLGVMWLIALGVWAYRYRTKYRTNRPVIAQYEPYQGILPMYTGVLFDGKLDPRDITAGIVYLAEQGFIKIKKTEEKFLIVFSTNEYELTLLRNDIDVLPVMLKQVLFFLFTDFAGDFIKKFKLTVETIVTQLQGGTDATQPLVSGLKVTLAELTKKAASNKYIIDNLKTAVIQDLEKDGYIFPDLFHTQLPKRWLGSILLGTFAFAGIVYALGAVYWLLMILVTFGVVVVVTYGRLTALGYEARNYLQGFKLFLSVTEKERYKFFNAPEKSPELFMQYLPYAIAFGVEKEWSKVFDGITLSSPAWYEGGNAGLFSAAAFSNDFSSFSSSFATSSGSGISGSSGGGSVGGGGGGGGGGSW